MKDEVELEIRNFIRNNFPLAPSEENFTDDASFLEKGIVDSTGVLELVAFLEQRFGVSVADEELVPENLDSVSRVANFVRRKQATDRGAA